MKILSVTLFTSIVALSGCSSIPDCSSLEAKNLLVKIIKEKVTGSENGTWFIDPRFDIINTVSKLDNGFQCHAQITFTIPEQWNNTSVEKLDIEYKIQKNEASKDSFSISAIANFTDIKNFNNKGWDANQNTLFKKAGLEFLAPDRFVKMQATLQNNPLAALGAMGLLDELNFKKVHQRLLDAGWTYDGTAKDDDNLAIYSKDKFVLNIKANPNAFGLIVDPDDSSIWEK